MKTYKINPYAKLDPCEHFSGKPIGSYLCTVKCEFCSDYECDTDHHGRMDSFKFNCNFKKDENI